MQFELRPILLQSRAFELGRLAGLQPQPPGLGDGDALTVGRMNAGAKLRADFALIGVGLALASEALEPSLASLVGVSDDPSRALLAC
jgi:hypothetical protein